jgi:glycerol-3-phosphate O-acyltransferase
MTPGQPSAEPSLQVLPGGLDERAVRFEPAIADDPYGSRMLPRLGPLLRLFSWVFFNRIEDDSDLREVHEAGQRGSLVYVMRTRSLLDYLFFNTFLLRRGLPLAEFANGVSTTAFGPVAAAWRRFRTLLRMRHEFGEQLPDPIDSGYLCDTLARGSTALLFLRQGRTWPFRGGRLAGDLVEALVEAQERREEPIFVVPQVLIWSRAPDRGTRGLVDVLLGGTDDPGRLRKLAHFFVNYHHAVVKVGTPLNLQEFIAEQEGQERPRVAKKLRWLLLGYLYRERKVVKGPDVRPRRWLFNRVLEEPGVREQIVAAAQREGRPLRVVEKRARKILDRMGADFRFGVIMTLRLMLDVITSRIYSGVEFSVADVERIREAARNGTVLLLPSHRSHFDYLLLSWLLYHQGMMPPHIAAGVNLSFWPLGAIFRRAGAYFIRRSFSGDPLYSSLVSHYLRALLAEGYTQEFFLEGGRSRTGKMLPGKIGLLSIYVEAMADRVVPDIQMVPVYIAYEKIVEDYSRELTGEQKHRETASGLVRSASVLRKRFGRVYAKTNEPISLKEMLGVLDKPYRELEDHERKAFLKRLVQHLAAEIQDVTVVTPSAVAATVLLTHDRRGISRELFHQRSKMLTRWLESRGAHFSDSWHFPEDALDEALEMFQEEGLTEVVRDAAGFQVAASRDVIAISSEVRDRLSLDYLHNSMLFHFVPAAFVCTALQVGTGDEQALTKVQRRFDFLMDLFQAEFVFHPDLPSEHLLSTACAQLAEHGVIELLGPDEDDTLRAEKPERWVGDGLSVRIEGKSVRLLDQAAASLFIATIRSLLEAYYVVLRVCTVLRQGPLSEEDLILGSLNLGRRMFLTEDVTRPEAASKVNLTNAVRHFRKKGVFVPADGSADADALLVLDEEVRERYLAPIRRLFLSEWQNPAVQEEP